jgi:hypothetical protein
MNSILEIRQTVVSHLDEFVKWPKEASLLWNGCSRDGYHTYPSEILNLLRERGIYRRGWSNDPAIHAFLLGFSFGVAIFSSSSRAVLRTKLFQGGLRYLTLI